MRESRYQRSVIQRLEEFFPGCLIFKAPSEQIQGVPDLLILFNCTWAALEVKRSENEPPRPNQPYYVDLMNEMSYASFIYPENEERVFDDLHATFGACR